MKPMFEETQTGVTLNLTKPFIGWTAVFVVLAVIFDSSTMLWVALLPWLAMVVFIVGMWIFATIVTASWWFAGKPITYTNRKGEKRIIQRGK